MALRIACDLDGTIADMDTALQQEAERLFGPDVNLRAGSSLPLAPLQSPAHFGAAPDAQAGEPAEPPADVQSPKRGLSERQQRSLWAHVGRIENFWRGLAEVEAGAVARFADLAAAHRWEVIFLTQRPSGAGDTAQRQSQSWLEAHGFHHPSVFVMNGSRGKVADALALDAVLDDRPDNCLDVVTDSTAKAFLVWRDPPAAVPPGADRLGITLTYSFAEALGHLEKMTEARLKRPSLIERLRGAIGV